MISEYQVGKNALFEAERIKNELFNFEHDLWEYLIEFILLNISCRGVACYASTGF